MKTLVPLGDQAIVNTHDNYGDQNTWVTVKNEFYRAFKLQACSDASLSLTEGKMLTFFCAIVYEKETKIY